MANSHTVTLAGRLWASRSYLRSLIALGSIPVIQFVTFTVSAYGLGVSEFGHFVSMQAPSAILLEVAGLGAGELLIRDVARDPSRYPHALGRFWAVAWPTTLVAIAGNVVVVACFLPRQIFWLAVIFGAGEIASFRVLLLWEQAAIAHGDFRYADAVRLTPAILRLVVTLALFAFRAANLQSLTVTYVATGLMSGLAVAGFGLNKYGMPKFARLEKEFLLDGLPFALNQLARAGQYNVDRLIMAALLPPSAVAVYTAANKFVQIGSLPVTTFLRMWYPRMFRAGAQSLAEILSVATRALPIICGIAAVSATGLALSATFLPSLLGHDFNASAPTLRALSPVIVISAAGYLGADSLTGSDRPYYRVALLLCAVLAQAATVTILAGAIGVYAGVVGLYVSACLFAALCWWTAAKINITATRKGFVV